MVSRGSVRHVVALFGVPVALIALTLAANVVIAGGSPDCDVRVQPRVGPAGTRFVFSGSGFVPTELSLRRGKAEPVVHDLSLTGDSWEVAVSSRVGDEATWRASFSADEGCTTSVEFRVTLQNTDVQAHHVDKGTPSAPTLMYLMVVGFGMGGGAFLARRLDASRERQAS